ncbi:MAG: rhodanese-related sulfurtransferase [Hyphomicrobiaceae bacterium]
MTFTVAALYRFTSLDDPNVFRGPLLDICTGNDCFGTLLLAREGINGTIAGPADGIDQVIGWIRQNLPGCGNLDVKYSHAEKNPFLRMKVRLKKEIVTMGVPDIDPNRSVGTYVEPENWNALISDPDVIVIDTRNQYEVDIGTFQGALDPHTSSFREFPGWFHQNKILNPDARKPQPKIAMFCTGGIRCEKASAYLKEQGVEEVYHLRGGILKYLEEVPEDESLWKGECFVFDQRVAVGHGLTEGTYDQCFACRHPIADEHKSSPLYTPGVCCPLCHDRTGAEQKARFAERQKQMTIAKRNGRAHLGSGAQIPAGHAPRADQPSRQTAKK